MRWTLVNWCPETETMDVGPTRDEPRGWTFQDVKPWLPILFGVVNALCGRPM